MLIVKNATSCPSIDVDIKDMRLLALLLLLFLLVNLLRWVLALFWFDF